MIKINSAGNFSARPGAWQAIGFGGLAVGFLDGAAAIISAAVAGVSPVAFFSISLLLCSDALHTATAG